MPPKCDILLISKYEWSSYCEHFQRYKYNVCVHLNNNLMFISKKSQLFTQSIVFAVIKQQLMSQRRGGLK